MMRRTILILLAMLTLAPAAVSGQDSESLYNGWGFGFQVGAGGLLPTGSMGDELKGCALFTGGLNVEYDRLRLKAAVSYGQPSFNNENPYAVRDSEGRNIQLNATANPTLLATGVQLGCTVWQGGKVSVTPAVGLSASRLSWDINHIKYEKDDDGIERPMIEDVTATRENTLGWLASVDIDIRLHGKLVDRPAGDGQAHYTSSLRITPFVTHGRYGRLIPAASGCCLGVTVSYAGLLRLMK